MEFTKKATELDDLINRKTTRIRMLIEDKNFFDAGYEYYVLARIQDKIHNSYNDMQIKKWEKYYLLDCLTIEMVIIINLVEEKYNETISKCKSNL
jgi:hypothetical protein